MSRGKPQKGRLFHKKPWNIEAPIGWSESLDAGLTPLLMGFLNGWESVGPVPAEFQRKAAALYDEYGWIGVLPVLANIVADYLPELPVTKFTRDQYVLAEVAAALREIAQAHIHGYRLGVCDFTRRRDPGYDDCDYAKTPHLFVARRRGPSGQYCPWHANAGRTRKHRTSPKHI